MTILRNTSVSRLVLLALSAAVLAGCAGNYKPDPRREAKQTRIIKFVHSTSEDRNHF